jgi:Universal stress protein family
VRRELERGGLAKKTIKRRKGVRLRSVVGNPSDEIVAVAKTTGAQVIVLGIRGIGRLQRLVLGSVSESVLLESECTVVITKRSGSECRRRGAESVSTFCHEARRRNANNTEPARFVVMLLKAKGLHPHVGMGRLAPAMPGTVRST